MPPLTTLSPPRRYVLGFVLLSLLDARSRPVSSGDAVTNDYSQFERFEFRQESGFGFCPLQGAPYKATIVRRPAGGYSFGESVLEERVMKSADCIPLVRSGTCLVARQLPSRELAPEEVSRLKAVFSQIIVRTSPDAKCQGQLVIDYCRTIRCRWDDHLHNDAECQRDSLPKSQIDQLLMLLEELHRRGVADREKSPTGKATRTALVAVHLAIERSLMSGIAIREQRWRMTTSTMPSQLFGPPNE